MDAGLEELVLSGALFNGNNEGTRSPVRSRSVTPEPNTDDELFGSDISRPESPADPAASQNSIGKSLSPHTINFFSSHQVSDP